MEEPKNLKYNHYTETQLLEEYRRQLRFNNREEANLIFDQAVWTKIRSKYMDQMIRMS